MMGIYEARSASPMLIAQQTEAFDDPDWIYELKMDGFRCLAYIERNSVDFRNKRNMQMLPKFPELAEIYKNVNGRCILDGEIVVLADGVPDFYRLQKRTLLTDPFKIELEAGRFPASFVAFDCIYQGNQELVFQPLMERKQKLSNMITENDRIAVSRYIEKEGTALYQAAETRELEGVVAKRKESLYFMGKRTKDWVKFKRMADEEFIVAGYIQKGEHTFSFVLAKYRLGRLVYKGHVTSGVTKDAVMHLKETGRNPFQMLPTGNESAVWVEPDQVCVVEYMSNTLHSLRQPVFKGFRDDILPEDVQISGNEITSGIMQRY